MIFTKLEHEKFSVKHGVNKPGDKYFPNSNIKLINNNRYEISSNLKDKRMMFSSRYLHYNTYLNIIKDNFVNAFPDLNLEGYYSNYVAFSYTDDRDLIVFSFDRETKNNFDYPIQLTLDDKGLVELNTTYPFLYHKIKLNEKTRIYITSCRSYIFELIYKEYMGLFKNDYSSIKDFIFNLEPNKTYTDDFFKENEIIPRPLIYNNGLINIPIFEKIGDNWIFYQHNFDKYRDKIFEKNG